VRLSSRVFFIHSSLSILSSPFFVFPTLLSSSSLSLSLPSFLIFVLLYFPHFLPPCFSFICLFLAFSSFPSFNYFFLRASNSYFTSCFSRLTFFFVFFPSSQLSMFSSFVSSVDCFFLSRILHLHILFFFFVSLLFPPAFIYPHNGYARKRKKGTIS
jgi:hypothetical protein